MARIEVYTKFFCPYCTRAMALLKRKGAEFEEIDISMGGPRRTEMIERSSGRTTQSWTIRRSVSSFSLSARLLSSDRSSVY